MKKTAVAAFLATSMVLAPWQGPSAADSGDFLYGQRLYSLGDYAGALTIWQPLAKQGDARAQFSMAVLHLKGRGAPRDLEKAMEWARQAAAQGYKPGQRLLQKLQRMTAKATAAAQTKRRQVTKQRKGSGQTTELQRIEGAVGDLLQQIAGKIAKDGALEHGDLRAAQLADAIEVTVPDIVIHAADGAVFDIGTVVAHVRRLDARYDNITLALPGNMRFRKADGSKGTIAIARRLAKLRWDRQLATSTEFEFRLAELVLSLEAGGEMGRIGEVLVQAAVPEDKGLWSGPMRITLTNVVMTNGGNSTLRLGHFSLDMELRGLDLSVYYEGSARAGAKNQAKLGDNPTLQQILGLANGFGLRGKINKLALRHPGQGEFRLEQADYGLNLSSSDDGHMLNLAVTTSHHGLTGTGGAAPDGMVPRDLDIAVALENIPSETVVNVGLAAVIELALLGKFSSGPEVFKRLRKELSAAAASFRLKHAKITAQDYDIAMSANLLADGAAEAGIVGDGELRVSGLQKLLAAVQQDSGKAALVDHMVAPLSALIEKGKPINGGAGQLFILAVHPDGQLTVNGDPVLSLAPFAKDAEQ